MKVRSLTSLKENQNNTHKLFKSNFYLLLFMHQDTVNQDELDFFNEVAPDDEVKDDHREYMENANKLREKHRDLKDSYDNLERKAAQGRNRQEFVDPKVISLWNVALENNFTASELAALKVINQINLSFSKLFK